MKTQTIFPTFFFLLISIHLGFGQTDILEFETNIEYQLEYVKNQSSNYTIEEGRIDAFSSTVKTIKQNPFIINGLSDKFFSETLFHLLKEGEIKAYSLESNEELTNQDFSWPNAYEVDTIILFDLKTKEEMIKIVTYPKIDKVNSYIIKQKWSYDLKTGKLWNQALGIIPVSYSKENRSELMWIPFGNNLIDKDFHSQATSLDWLVLTEDHLDLSGKETSNTTLSNFNESMFEKILKNDYELFTPVRFDNQKLLEHSFVNEVLIQPTADTTIIFDPQTYTEEVKVQQYDPLQPKDIVGYKVIQLWYFDKVKNSLNSKLIGFGPIFSFKREEEEDYRVLFMIKND